MKKMIVILVLLTLGIGLTALTAQETPPPPPPPPQEAKQEAPAQPPAPAVQDTVLPEIKKFGGFWYVYMDFNGEYKKITPNFDVFKAEFDKQNLKASGPQFITFYNPPSIYKGDDLKWACCYYTDKDIEVKPPLMKKYIEPILSVIMMHRSGSIWETFKKVQDYIKEKAFVKAWPAYEVYHTTPRPGIEVIHPIEEPANTK